jgi:hypothetical protein
MNIDLNIEFEIEDLPSCRGGGYFNIKGFVVGSEIEDNCPDDAPTIKDFDLSGIQIFYADKWSKAEKYYYPYFKCLIKGNGNHERNLHEKIREAYYKHLREMEK